MSKHNGNVERNETEAVPTTSAVPSDHDLDTDTILQPQFSDPADDVQDNSSAQNGSLKYVDNIQNMLSNLGRSPPKTARSTEFRRKLLTHGYRQPLDRVNVLEGHSGCVNALSWAQNGELLLSGGDDTTVRLWRIDSEADGSTQYPFKCDAILHTPHTGNIFNAQLLPGSSRIATVAGDGRVCVFNAERAITTSSRGREKDFTSTETCIQVLRCHSSRTKRIVTEGSPDLFLTVAEDGTVRQHDLRLRHQCRGQDCPPPLLKLPHDLTSAALSPLTPYHIVVAGESPYGYLFDRRQAGRIIQEEWGVPCETEDSVTCVRRFGRANRGDGSKPSFFDHITGARMAKSNGHEVLLSYSSDAVYLYSTRDDPTDSVERRSSVVKPNDKQGARPSTSHSQSAGASSRHSPAADGVEDREQTVRVVSDDVGEEMDVSKDGNEQEEEEENIDDSLRLETKFRTPIVLPRARYAGARNVETVKDVNFIGPSDEFISSGSDDGNFFLWEKSSKKVHGIYEGDESIVNVVEDHPWLPLLAVSGIDKTVKLFAPAPSGSSKFSRISELDRIIERNTTRSRLRDRSALRSLLLQYQLARGLLQLEGDEDGDGEGEGGAVACTYQ